ncbi:hypothetical protein DXG03_005618 [Asterophora parasitica]|uniref:Uncharacterized protein n=1 Tax=Asterophora parasitica TaxID=117018 RepID=A0A9P7GEP3_9AGAR|nr:hypothetical protein DXG03_005618 [Asterophora parasitica]
MATVNVANGGRLTDNYANAPEEQGIVRQSRAVYTVYRPDIAPKWVSILQNIIACEQKPFGSFLLSIGVTPSLLAYDLAVAAAASAKVIFAASGLAEVEVAFVEMVVKRWYRKPFSSALGLHIAPLNTPYYEGTGALYFRLSSQAKDIALLTCAHVAQRPPELPDNRGMTWPKPRELIVALSYGGYNTAVNSMTAEIAKLTGDIETWSHYLKLIPTANAARRQQLTLQVKMATNRINQLDESHSVVTKFRSTPQLQTVGWFPPLQPPPGVWRRVLGRDQQPAAPRRKRFSNKGDSGFIVLTGEGKILGMLTGGAGPISKFGTDVVWLTPFHYLLEQIKKKYPDAFLYDAKN